MFGSTGAAVVGSNILLYRTKLEFINILLIEGGNRIKEFHTLCSPGVTFERKFVAICKATCSYLGDQKADISVGVSKSILGLITNTTVSGSKNLVSTFSCLSSPQFN